MAANRIGKLYCYKYGQLPIWGNALDEIGTIPVSAPFLIIQKENVHNESWAKILYQDKIGWIKLTYITLDWVDPEEYV